LALQVFGCEDVLLSCCGNAYDTRGTNLIAYDFLRHMFFTISRVKKITTENLRAHYLARVNNPAEKDLGKLYRKVELTEEDVLFSFPALARLEALHVYDEGYLDECEQTDDMYFSAY